MLELDAKMKNCFTQSPIANMNGEVFVLVGWY